MKTDFLKMEALKDAIINKKNVYYNGKTAKIVAIHDNLAWIFVERPYVVYKEFYSGELIHVDFIHLQPRDIVVGDIVRNINDEQAKQKGKVLFIHVHHAVVLWNNHKVPEIKRTVDLFPITEYESLETIHQQFIDDISN